MILKSALKIGKLLVTEGAFLVGKLELEGLTNAAG
jgi:hypothetical protein